MLFEHISVELILFLILYGVTGVVPLIAALYLLLRRGNAFMADITPPLRLRRWAASFFAIAALDHVWWMMLYIFSGDFHSEDDMFYSVAYVSLAVFDCMAILTTITGTLLAMLQDRRRPVWPVFAAMLPFVVLGVILVVSPSKILMQIGFTYIFLLYVLFTVYLVFAIRQYGRWLRDNYADLEHKEVWFIHVLSLAFLLLFIFYLLVDNSIGFMCFLHFIELVVFVILLYRVETLPLLAENSTEDQVCNPSEPEAVQLASTKEQQPTTVSANINIPRIEQLLEKHCVDTQLYLQHDLTLHQLAQTLGTNRSYLSQYFSSQNITYNTYINNLRINYFINRYQDVAGTERPFTVRRLASESGYRSYSTFSLAFKQRMGQSVTAWMLSK